MGPYVINHFDYICHHIIYTLKLCKQGLLMHNTMIWENILSDSLIFQHLFQQSHSAISLTLQPCIAGAPSVVNAVIFTGPALNFANVSSTAFLIFMPVVPFESLTMSSSSSVMLKWC